MKCSWCGSDARDIGPETTGSEASMGWHVWLCTKEGCGHEMSGPPAHSEKVDTARAAIEAVASLAAEIAKGFGATREDIDKAIADVEAARQKR